MYKQLFCWISLAFVLGWAAVAAGQENVIVNGEFDSDLDSWGLYGSAGFTVSVVQDAPTETGPSGSAGPRSWSPPKLPSSVPPVPPPKLSSNPGGIASPPMSISTTFPHFSHL